MTTAKQACEDERATPAVGSLLDRPVGRLLPKRLAEAGLTAAELDGLPPEVLKELLLDKKRRGPGSAAKPKPAPKPKLKNGAVATLTRKVGWLGKDTETFQVRVIVRAEGYAMVRRKGAVPFVCSESDLTLNEFSTALASSAKD